MLDKNKLSLCLLSAQLFVNNFDSYLSNLFMQLNLQKLAFGFTYMDLIRLIFKIGKYEMFCSERQLPLGLLN